MSDMTARDLRNLLDDIETLMQRAFHQTQRMNALRNAMKEAHDLALGNPGAGRAVLRAALDGEGD